MKYQCISDQEGAGKPLKQCQMVTVNLTLYDENDHGNFSITNNKDRSIELRRRCLVRIVEEAKEQGGYLTQEDLSRLLKCDIRTIRRDTKDLKDLGIILPNPRATERYRSRGHPQSHCNKTLARRQGTDPGRSTN